MIKIKLAEDGILASVLVLVGLPAQLFHEVDWVVDQIPFWLENNLLVVIGVMLGQLFGE